MFKTARMFQLVVWLGSAGWVLAATQASLLPDTIPLVQYLYALALSFWGGLASTLQRYARADESGNQFILIARDVVCSISAGLLAFYALSHFAVPPMLAAIGVFIAGYGGSRALEAAYTALENRGKRAIEALGGAAPSAPVAPIAHLPPTPTPPAPPAAQPIRLEPKDGPK